jgi:hypothetical protein
MKNGVIDTTPSTDWRNTLSTQQLAKYLQVEAQTIRSGLSRKGNYLGIRPSIKLPNGRLLWDANEVERLLTYGGL